MLVVHGIGAQKRGETAAKLLAGLARVEPSLAAKSVDDELTLDGRPLRLYEVHWADRHQGELAKGSFDIRELQSVCWFPLLNQLRGNYRPGAFPLWRRLWWFFVLPVVTFLSFMALRGAALFFDVATRKNNAFDSILDEYVGDVFSYVNSAGEALDPTAARAALYAEVVQRFYDQLVKAHADGCREIHVVAHSLGTVVTYHALSGLRFDAAQRADAEAIRAAYANVRHLYTIGSPLEKIRFFWPRLMSGQAALGKRAIEWDNFVSYCDPVAGSLRAFSDWGALRNHHLLGGGFIRGHLVYERSPVFLGALTKGLVGRELPLPRTRRERWIDFLLLLGETIVTPLGALLVLVAGAALVVMVVLILPWLVSWVLRWFLPETVWQPITDWMALIIAVCFGLSMLLAPLLRARDTHRRYWCESSSPTVTKR